MLSNVKVGITSWTEKSLVQSGWYPKSAHTAEARLRYYASRFPIVEVDSTYYAIPSLHQAEVWVERTPDDFTINVKAFATMTEHYTDPKRLPPDLRQALPTAIASKARVYPKDLGDELLDEIARRFRAAIEPIRASGKLGVVLFQFPVWIPCSAPTRRLVVRTPSLVPGCRVAVELRNATWMNERNRDRTLDLFREVGIVYTCVDEPQGFPSSIPPIAAATADVALVRMHGRSRASWARTTKSARERFRYRYSVGELREWVPKIRRLADEASTVHVLFNNCYSDYAVRNASELRELLEERMPTTRVRHEHPEHPPRAP